MSLLWNLLAKLERRQMIFALQLGKRADLARRVFKLERHSLLVLEHATAKLKE